MTWKQGHTIGLTAIVSRSVQQDRQYPRLRLSQAGMSCVREVYYRATGAPCEPTDRKGLTKMAIGTAFDAWALPSQRYVGFLDGKHVMFHSQVRVELRAGEVTVSGKTDGVFYEVEQNGEWFTLRPILDSDLKVVGISTWEKVKEAPKQEHAAQVNQYAYAIGSPMRSVLYVNASTGEYLEHFDCTDEFAARKDFGLYEEAFYWMKRGTPPPRPYEDIEEDEGTKLARDAFPCRFCAYRPTCWGVKAERMSDDDEPVQAA